LNEAQGEESDGGDAETENLSRTKSKKSGHSVSLDADEQAITGGLDDAERDNVEGEEGEQEGRDEGGEGNQEEEDHGENIEEDVEEKEEEGDGNTFFEDNNV
jgi:hypothetical protein